MSDVAETVVAAQEPEIVEAAPSEEQPDETPVVVEEKIETSTENGEEAGEEEKAEEVSTPAEETTEAEAEAEAEEKAPENGEAKDTNGNDRKRVSSAHEEDEVEETEEDAPAVKKTKVDEEVDTAAAGDAPVAAAAE